MFKKTRIVALLLAIVIILPGLALADDKVENELTDKINIERISGTNRYDTSISVSKAAFEKSEYAVIASGETFPDALVGGVLAGELDAPLLVTPKNSVSNNLISELERLEVSKVYLLGGLNTLTENVEKSLEKFNVKRLSGTNRYETAKKVEAEYRLHEDNISNIYYADGRNFPDALAAAPYVEEMDGVLLLNNGSIITEGIAIGGVNSVPGNIDRIAGANRYDTAVNIAKKYSELKGIILVDGTNYPDALSAAGYASKKDMAILLTNPNNLPTTTKEFITNSDLTNIIIIGGENSVSENIKNEILGKEEPKPSPNPNPIPDPKPDQNPEPSQEPNSSNYYGRTDEELDKLWVDENGNGLIKGNYNKSTKERIYHLPGWQSYNRVEMDRPGKRWFKTEREAIDNGWRPDERYQR